MLTCENCGCLVDPEATKTHEDWHEKLVLINKGPVANPNRTKLDSLTIAPCTCGKPGC